LRDGGLSAIHQKEEIMTAGQIDQAKAEAFAGRLMETLNGAFLTLLISVGHRTGLLDAMAPMGAATSAEIAKAAGLNERYVREWLGGMTTGRIVEYDPASRTYRLPPEHAAFTTTAAGSENMAYFAQYIALAGLVEDEIVDCFRNGGGVPYSAFPKFQELQGGESLALYDAALIPAILPLAEGLRERLATGIDVADLGCGQGHAVNVMAREFPNSRFIGYDFSEEGVETARREAADWGLTNASFEVADVAALDESETFDLVTAFDAVHDQAAPRKMLANAYQSLRPGGVFLVMDIAASSELHENMDHPMGSMLYAISTLHCMTVSLAQGGEGLGTVWGEKKAVELIREAGFAEVETKHLEGDVFHAFFVARR
jgi:2-polyprenyl-3-methyl-5-hydroxy-6-metoxy-1,4-benzoquinol methylase